MIVLGSIYIYIYIYACITPPVLSVRLYAAVLECFTKKYVPSSVSLWCTGPDLRVPDPRLSTKRATHQTVSVVFLANDRCVRDYDLVVAHR